jgi:isopenicillin-N N-acyltransferase-like protein
MKSSKVEVTEVSGKPHDRGYQYGEKFKNQIEQSLGELYSSFNRTRKWKREQLLIEGRKYIPFIEEYVPEIGDEIKGIAQGAGIEYDEMVALISYYELGEGIPNLCTCFGVTGEATVGGETYIGQNWDGGKPVPGVMLRVERDSGPNVLTYADYGFPAAYGLNSEGITVVWNSVHCEKSQLGVPAYLIVREALHQKLLSEVIDKLIKIKRAESLNFIIADKNGEVYNFEATPNDYDLTYCEKTIVHANHFVSNKLKIERDLILSEDSNTMIRHNRMAKLINKKCSNINLETAMSFQKDHANYPKSICRHLPAGATCSASVIVPEKREMYVSFGNPCENEYHKYEIQ